ncbi:MAG TPA: P22 phage major capsid protein family protein [Vicinamibacterales bacterium]|nr:P22 phage major capsid protein family protein [Vicinamibacterales bacterium]
MNTIANSTWVTKETARYFLNDLTVLADGNVNRDYDDQYEQAGAKVGNTVLARMPQRFQALDGQALQLQNIFDQTVPVTLTNQKQVAFGYSSAQATTELDSIRSRYCQPGAEALANAAEVLFFQGVYRDIYQTVGMPGSTPGTQTLYLQAGTKLTDLATPLRGRKAVLDPMAMQTLAGSNATLFNPTAVISENYKMGMFGRQQLGIDEWYQDPVVPAHTTGSFTASTPIVSGANQTGSSLSTTGWASGATTLNKGDTFTIAGVNSVNPLAYSSNGRLQEFVVKATVSDSSGAIAALQIDPPIITSGQLQTVDASPAANAAITVRGATNPVGGTLTATVSRQSFVYHPDFATFVMADLVKPGAGAEATVINSRALRFSIRMVEQYQITTDQMPTRLDLLAGAATLQARLAVRVWG